MRQVGGGHRQRYNMGGVWDHAVVVLCSLLALCGGTHAELISFNTTELQRLMVKKAPFPHIVVKHFVPPGMSLDAG